MTKSDTVVMRNDRLSQSCSGIVPGSYFGPGFKCLNVFTRQAGQIGIVFFFVFPLSIGSPTAHRLAEPPCILPAATFRQSSMLSCIS